MTDFTMLNAKDFNFAPFAIDVGGDSGSLELAALKSDKTVQYIVKSGYSEIACNEFIYHHVAAAFGLHTLEARLFAGIPGKQRAVGIRFVPNIKEFRYDEASDEDRRSFYKFKMLYVILNEEDSEEYFYDELNRFLKLDNAASFNMDEVKVNSALMFGNKLPQMAIQLFERSIEFLEYDKYRIQLEILNSHFGETAAKTAFEFIKEFSDLDVSKIYPACEFLKNVYPVDIANYYPIFIERRIAACKQFLSENDISQFT